MNANDSVVQIDHRNDQQAQLALNNACRIGAILVNAGKLSQSDAARVLDLQRREGFRFGEAALRLSLISERDLVTALHQQYDLPMLTPGHGGFSEDLVAAYQPYHRRTEELRTLRTQLMIRWLRHSPPGRPVLAVVSPGAGEGRSYVAANLAVLFSQLGERTLLIDGDLRNPRQHKIFDVPDRVGLSTILGGRAEPDVAIEVPGFRDLVLLPAGAPPPNPLELLSRPVLPTLLTDYLDEFDVILVDTPPALLFSDAQAVSFRAGSAMVIAHQNHTRQDDIGSLVRKLTDSGTTIVGTVMNHF